MTSIIIEVLFEAPGGEDLARNLQTRLEGAVVSQLVDATSDAERAGISVTSEIVDDEGEPV